ncbi:hypothetical protein JCM8202_000058 [Rhodotorula sphaerocarpa]
MSTPADQQALIAPQDVASAILAPYVAGLLTQVLLIGSFLVLFGQYVVKGDLAKHGATGRYASWTVFVLILCCLGVSAEEIIDTGMTQQRSSEELFNGPPQSNVLPVLSGLTAAVCQFFLAGRAGSLINNRTHKWAFLAITTILTILAFAGSLLFSAAGFQLTLGHDSIIDYKVAQALWLWASAAVDLLISIALARTLHARIAHFNEVTDSLLKRLIVTALQTAAYTSVISIIGAALSSAYSHSEDFHTASVGFAFWSPLPVLHAISLYTTLSARRSISDTLSGSGQNNSGFARSQAHADLSAVNGQAYRLSTFKRSGVPGADEPTSFGTKSRRDSPPAPLQVNVQQEQTVSFDVRSEYDEEYVVDQKL